MTKPSGRFTKPAAPRRVTAQAPASPFSDFLERDRARQRRDRSRRRTFFISLGIHVFALIAVLIYSLYDVDELFSPSVEVKVMDPSKLPPGVLKPERFVPPKPAPAP